MAYLRVNHKEFEKAAASLEKYVETLSSGMKAADQEVKQNLGVYWTGSDYEQFKAKWSKINEPDGNFGKMRKSLENYATFLRGAAESYKQAHIDIVRTTRSYFG